MKTIALSRLLMKNILLEEYLEENGIVIIETELWKCITETVHSKRVIFTLNEKFYGFNFYRRFVKAEDGRAIFDYDVDNTDDDIWLVPEVFCATVEVDVYLVENE